MKAVVVVLVLMALLVPSAIAGRISQRYYAYQPGTYLVAGSCDTGYKCEDNKYSRCMAGKWHVLEMCTPGEQCMAGGCRTVRITRFPQVTITPSMAPVRPYVYVTNGSIFRNTARIHS